MISYPKSSGITLSIVGSSGSSGIFSTRPLYLKSDFGSSVRPLYLKSSPTGVSTPAYTNWDASLVSNARINGFSNGDVEYEWTDFSSNRYDSYYPTNQGRESLSYTLSHEWAVNDLAVDSDLLVVATKDYTSFEKYTIESDAKVVAGYFGQLQYYWTSSSYTEETVYNYSVYWDTFHLNSISYTADLVITYEYGDQTLESRTTINDNDDGTIYFTSTSLINPLTDIVWEGDPNDNDFWDTSPPYTTSVETIEHTVPPPLGSVARNGAYILPSELDPKLSRFLIPNFVQIFEDQNHTWFKFAGNTTLIGSEVPDYSDIFLRIAYDSTAGPDSGYLYSVDDGTERLYKFGGFIKFDDFYAGLLDRATIDDKPTISNDKDFYWYIILKDGMDAGEYYSIGLSNYVTWDYTYNTNVGSDEYNKLTYYKSSTQAVDPGSAPNPNYAHYEPLDLRFISTKWVEVIKVAGFPNCGKVDLYFPKVGIVHDFQSGWNTVTSSGHGLSTGDRIKFTEVLGSGNSLRGLRYVIPIDSDRFNIYYDKEGSDPAYINNVSTPTGIRWSAIDGNTWKYSTTLYSPTDKNGYGTGLRLISSYEPPSTGETPLDRAVEWPKDKPQADFTGQRSWNNYYPYERFSSNENIAYEVINGNKFGVSIATKKIDYRYLLLVAEEGASESFDIISSYATNEEEPRPKNQRVVPSYLPYGRLHFYIVDPVAQQVEYLTSHSPSDNPWIGYETINLQERLLGVTNKWENSSISENDLYSWNNISNNYWNGARFLQWGLDYVYNSELETSFPNQNAHLNHYGFIDRIKTADVSLVGSGVRCVYSTNVKDADFYNSLRIPNLDSRLRVLDFNLSTPSVKTSTSFKIDNSTFSTNDVAVQKAEYLKFGKSIKLNDDDLYFGWSAQYRPEEYIYYYKKSGSTYSVKDTITSVGANSFGERFVVDDRILLSDDKTNQIIKIFKYDGFGNQYYNVSDFAVNDNILSYGLLNDVFVLRNSSGYAGYSFDRITNEFSSKFFREISKTTADSVMKLSVGDHAAFFDSGVEYDVGSYHRSLQIIDAGNVDELSLNSYVFSLDTHYPQFVPLFIKTIEGASSGAISAYSVGHTSYSSGVTLELQAPMPFSGGVDLFVKQTDIFSTGISLFHKSTSLESGNVPLIVQQQMSEEPLTLFLGSDINGLFNLYIRNETASDLQESDISLYINSFRTFSSCYYHDNDIDGNDVWYNVDGNVDVGCGYDGNIDGIGGGPSIKIPLFMYNGQTLPASSAFPLRILAPGTGISSSATLWNAGEDGSGNAFNGRSLYLFGSGYKGIDSSESFNLWMKSPSTDAIPLFVYNTVTTGNLPISISGANLTGTGLNLRISGVHVPNEILKLYVRGDL